MNTTPSFDNTVAVLVAAYLNGTLLKGACHACAVGNICAAAIGAKVINADRHSGGWNSADWSVGSPHWARVFMTQNPKYGQNKRPDRYVGAAKAQIDATGYSWQQLARVEWEFESAAKGEDEAAEFAGLMAVVDVLADIHGIDLTTATAAKALFVRA